MLLLLFVPRGSAVVEPPLPGPPPPGPPIPDVIRTDYTGTYRITAPLDYPKLRGYILPGRRLN